MATLLSRSAFALEVWVPAQQQPTDIFQCAGAIENTKIHGAGGLIHEGRSLSAPAPSGITMNAESQSPGRSCGQAYALCAASILLLLLAGAPLQLWFPALGLAGTELCLILLPAIWFVRRKGIGVVRGLAWHPVSAGIALRSVVLGIASCWIAGALDDLVSSLIPGNPPSSDDPGPQSVPELTLMIFVAAILPGICEETLFRGAIFGILQRKSTVKAVTLSAALFALYHLSPWALIPAFFAGLLFGMLRARTGSAVPGMIAHASSNATAFIASYLAPNDSLPAAVILFASVLFALAGMEFLHHTAQLLPARSPLATVPAALSRRFCLVVGLVVLLIIGLLVGLLIYRHIALSRKRSVAEQHGMGSVVNGIW